MPFYDKEGFEIEASEGFYAFLLDKGMDEDSAMRFASDFQENLNDAKDGEITWDEFHEWWDDAEDILEEEYGIDLEDYA